MKNKLFAKVEGENVMSADYQQERLDAQWIIGFVDGEGCFYVGFNRPHYRRNYWQVLPEFRVVQHKRDEKVLYQFKEFFGFGKVTVNHGERKEFRVRGLENLNKLVKFFKDNPLKTSKQRSFEVFAEIIERMNKGKHLTKEGLDKIAELASQMNRQVKSRYLESSETVRQTTKDG